MKQPKADSAYSYNNVGRVMTSEEFDQVIEAIALGRYSWACILILRIAGYNPLHYLPYRTYRRLIKENARLCTPSPLGSVETQMLDSTTQVAAKD